MPPALAETPPVAPTAASALSGLRARGRRRPSRATCRLAVAPNYNPRLGGRLLGRLVEVTTEYSCCATARAAHRTPRRATPTAAACGGRGGAAARRRFRRRRPRPPQHRRRPLGRVRPGKPLGRAGGEPVTREPCEFARRGGGADWRRTSKHRLRAARPPDGGRRGGGATSERPRARGRRRAVARGRRAVGRLAPRGARRAPPQPRLCHRAVVRRAARDVLSEEFVGGGHGGRRVRCACGRWAGAAIVEAVAAQPRLEIAAAPNVSGDWADAGGPRHVVRRARHGVRRHRSAYRSSRPTSSGCAHPPWLRFGATELPAIDNWLPHALPCATANARHAADGHQRLVGGDGADAPDERAQLPRRLRRRRLRRRRSAAAASTDEVVMFATRHVYTCLGSEGPPDVVTHTQGNSTHS